MSSKHRKRSGRVFWIVLLALALLTVLGYRFLDRRSAPVSPPEPTPAVTDAPDVNATPLPTPSYIPTPSPAPTEEPIVGPDVLSFYTPESIYYSPRVKLGDEFVSPMKRGEDIGSFEPIPSTESRLENKIFPELFDGIWTSFDGHEGVKIGYELRYALYDGTMIDLVIRSPKDIDYTDYIEVWIYDDYHQEPYEYYSHLRESWMTDDTLITSIKLTAGKSIKSVREIWLSAFLYRGEGDFDADGHYRGRVSCDLHIIRQNAE